MRTLARADGDEYVLNGSKMWITNGYVNGELGDLYLVYAKTGDLDNTRCACSGVHFLKWKTGYSPSFPL